MKPIITRRQFLEKVGLAGLIIMGGLSSLSNVKSEASIPNLDCPNCHGIMTLTTNPCGEVYMFCGHPASYGVPFSMDFFRKGIKFKAPKLNQTYIKIP